MTSSNTELLAKFTKQQPNQALQICSNLLHRKNRTRNIPELVIMATELTYITLSVSTPYTIRYVAHVHMFHTKYILTQSKQHSLNFNSFKNAHSLLKYFTLETHDFAIRLLLFCIYSLDHRLSSLAKYDTRFQDVLQCFKNNNQKS